MSNTTKAKIAVLIITLLTILIIAMQGGWLALVALVLFTVWREFADRVWFNSGLRLRLPVLR